MSKGGSTKKKGGQQGDFTWWERLQLAEFLGLRFGTWVAFIILFVPIAASVFFVSGAGSSPPKEHTIEARVIRLWSRHRANEYELDVDYFVSFETDDVISQCLVPRFYIDQWQIAQEGKLYELDVTSTNRRCFVTRLTLLPDHKQTPEGPFAE